MTNPHSIKDLAHRSASLLSMEQPRMERHMTATPRILVVEDDHSLRQLIVKELTALSFAVDEASDGPTGLEMALNGNYDLATLDLNLPQMDGLEICRRIRAENDSLAILMLTARKDELDRVLGLEMGADDYLTKPFAMRELLARVKAILRRATQREERTKTAKDTPDTSSLHFGPLVVDLAMRTVSVEGKPIHLSNMEFELVAFFAQSPGTAYSREELLERVWGYSAVGYEQNVTTHINRIRRKLEADVENPQFLKTVRGYGYAFAHPRDFAAA